MNAGALKPLFSAEEYRARWRAVHDAMKQRGLEAAVVWSRGGGTWDRFQEVFYLTNYYSCNSGYMYDGMQKGTRAAAHCAVILQANREPILIADDPTLDRAGIATTHIDAGTDVVALLAAALVREGIEGTVGFVGSDCIYAKHMTALRDLAPQIAWQEEDGLVLDLRIIKSPAELEVFRYAGETVSAALSRLFEVIFAGGSEADAAGEAAREVYRRQGHVNQILVAHGPWTTERITDTPTAGYSTATPQDGDLVRGWVYGAMYQGYWLDPGRTSVVGLRPTPDKKRLVESCADIVERLRAEIRPGVRVADIAALGDRLRREYYGDEAIEEDWYVFGHGNGLYFEPPIIAPGYDGKHAVFRENMVAATELFLNLPGVGSAGFEQNFIVTRYGTELLTTTPLIWW
jgi:Xaa-Pro dipeptidase